MSSSDKPKSRVLEENQIDREIKHRTGVAHKIASDACAQVDRYRQDAQRGKRLEGQTCKACYYFRPLVLAAPAVPDARCMTCGRDMRGEGDTRICSPCSKEHESCRRCMADLELRYQ